MSSSLCIWMLLATRSLDQGCTALAEYRVEEAVALLQRARGEGPYEYPDHVRLYEQLGLAYAYLDRKEQALQSFDMLLALDPGHAISYTLSPKVTFLFEQARKASTRASPITVDLGWPRDLKVSDRVPIDLEVVADPRGLMKRAVLFSRRKGSLEERQARIDLGVPGRYHRVELPAAAPASEGPEVLEVYLKAFDEKGNEVYLLGSAAQPREISLAYEPPEAWYSRWWVWALVGGAVAAGTGTTVYFLLREPPGRVGGSFQVP